MFNTPVIKLENISKEFSGHVVLNHINLSVYKNEFITLLGPSGCGKTTTLRIIAGFEQPTNGSLFLDGVLTNAIPPYKRKVNTVFQKYALFGHMNIFDNVAFGLKIKKVDKNIISKKVSEILELVNLKGFEYRGVESLSGGQQQRVAIARALVNEPEVLLLDEPLGALDLKLRKGMQTELKKIQRALGITFVYVTHDQEEALTMSDKIAVMNEGKIQQFGTPFDIYNEPVNAFVADFIGESNIIDGVMNEDFKVFFHNTIFDCVDKKFSDCEDVQVVVRPEDMKLVVPKDGMFTGIVSSVVFMGVHYEMMIETADYKWMIHSTIAEPIGNEVGIIIAPNDIHIMRRTLSEQTERSSVLDEN